MPEKYFLAKPITDLGREVLSYFGESDLHKGNWGFDTTWNKLHGREGQEAIIDIDYTMTETEMEESDA